MFIQWDGIDNRNHPIVILDIEHTGSYISEMLPVSGTYPSDS